MPSSRNLERLTLADYALPASITERLFSPALVVFLDHVRANVQQMLEYLGGDPTRWRPHVKTTKTPVIWRELVNAGVRHFKCATLYRHQRRRKIVSRQDHSLAEEQRPLG